MSTDDEVPPAEQTFADVLAGLSRARRRPRRHDAHPEPRPHPERRPAWPADEPQDEQSAAVVRPYAWTGGRTRSDFQLELETLVSTTARAEEHIHSLRTEHQAVVRLCHYTKSVAEVSALLSVPLGVVRVLLGDMAGLGLIQVHSNPTANGERPNLELLQRVLRGLSNLPAAPARPS